MEQLFSSSYSDLNPAVSGCPVGGQDESFGENLCTGSFGVCLVAESNGSILVGSNVSSDHRGEEEAVAVSRVQGSNLAIDLSRGTKGKHGSRSQKGGCGWTHV